MSPIRPENRGLYPLDWEAIVLRINQRAQNRCERCGVPNHARIIRDPGDGTYVEVTEDYHGGVRSVRVVLTTAHLNHDPTDNRDENLQALCQRCHNRHDAAHRRAGIVERRRAANRDLFEAMP